MTTWFRFYVILIALIAATAAQNQQLPDCAVACVESSLHAQSECTRDDASCYCSNVLSNDVVKACVSQSCSVKQGIASKKVIAIMCNTPAHDRTKITNLLCGVTGGLALLAIILRTSNALYIRAFGKDDACALAAGIFMVVDNAVTFPAGPAGYGLDIWNVPFENITYILKLVFLMQVFYWPVSAFTKLAFLFFYLRIFPGRALRNCIFATMGLTVLYWIVFQFGNIFYCSPISQVWNGWDGEHDGKCLNINTFMVAATGTNILIDAIIIALPIPDLPAIRRILSTHLPRIFATTHDSKGPSAYYADGTTPQELRRKKTYRDSLMNDTAIMKSVNIRVEPGITEDDEMQLVDMARSENSEKRRDEV